ncbi:response regulator [Runella sp.]|uniref:response regulator n=1 Tax=Runella sp. TaxID=1960881 RepID=UPI003D09CBB9
MADKILIVDEVAAMRRSVRSLLGQLGLNNVEESNSGASALEKLRSSSYDLIIANHKMESMTGLQLFAKVRADEKQRGTSFILMMGVKNPDVIAAAKEAGVEAFLVKPFKSNDIKSEMNKLGL